MKRRMGVFAALAVAVLVLGACGQGGTNGGTRADLQMEGTAADGQQEDGQQKDVQAADGQARQSEAFAETGTASAENAEKAGGEEPADAEGAYQHPEVTVISGEESFIPVEHLTYTVSAAAAENGEKETISDYGGYFQIGDIREMPIVPYDPQMRVQIFPAPQGDVGYRLYDQDGSMWESGTVSSLEELVLPRPETDYQAELRVSFGTEENGEGYQYFFQVTAQGPSPGLQLLAEPPQGLAEEGSRRQEIAAGKGLGALAEQIREDQLVYVPLGSRLALKFSPAAEPVQIIAYDLVLYDSSVEWIEERQWENKREMDVKAPEIILGVNPIAQERGYSEAYRTGGVIRGLLLRCRFADGREETYSAAVRTDAAAELGTGDVYATAGEEGGGIQAGAGEDGRPARQAGCSVP